MRSREDLIEGLNPEPYKKKQNQVALPLMVKTGNTGCLRKKHMHIILHLDGFRRMLLSNQSADKRTDHKGGYQTG